MHFELEAKRLHFGNTQGEFIRMTVHPIEIFPTCFGSGFGSWLKEFFF